MGCGGSKTFGCKSVDDKEDGSMFRLQCRWEVGVGLGCLPVTRRRPC